MTKPAKISVERRALAWLLGESTGVSSKTLCGHMLGIDVDWKSEPADASDRDRCIKLLKLIPEWIPRLDEMAKHAPRAGLVIGPGGIRTEVNSWGKQIPLIKQEGDF